MTRSFMIAILAIFTLSTSAFAGEGRSDDDTTAALAEDNREHIRGISWRISVLEDLLGDSEPEEPKKNPTPKEEDLEGARMELKDIKLTCIYLNMGNEVEARATLPEKDIPDPFVCESQLKVLERKIDVIFAREQGATVFVGACLDFIPVPGMGLSPCGVAGMGHWAEGKYSGYTVDLFAKAGPNPLSLGAGATTAIYRRARGGHWAHGVIVGGEIYDMNMVGSYRTDRTMTGTIGSYNRLTFAQGPKGYWDMEFIGGLKGGVHNVAPGVYDTEFGQNGWILLPGLEIRIRRRFKNRDTDPSKDPRL